MANRKREKPSEKPILTLKLSGPGVRRGRISVPDLINICEEAQNIINKQAEALKGRKTLHPGPTAEQIQQECTLELIGISKGSTELMFDLARPQMQFKFSEDFGTDVVRAVASTIHTFAKNGHSVPEDLEPGLLLSVYRLSNIIETGRIHQIRWVPSKDGTKRVSAPITERVRQRLANRLSRPRKVVAQVDGILDMADFKLRELKCRIDPPIGISVMCTFDQEWSDTIQSLLRKPVRITGEGTVRPYSDRVETLKIHSIVPLPSLDLGEGNFFKELSI